MRDTEGERQRHRQREKQAPCREPDVGLDPRSPGSGPGLKADTKPLSHRGCPMIFFSKHHLKQYANASPKHKNISYFVTFQTFKIYDSYPHHMVNSLLDHLQ